jgi:hypothetical protein
MVGFVLLVAFAFPVLFPTMNTWLLLVGFVFWWGVVFLAALFLGKL